MKESLDVYRQLQKRLDKLPIGYPATTSGVEIRILKHLFTPIEAQIAYELSFLPESVEKIFSRTKKIVPNITSLSEHLEEMTNKGAIVGHTTRSGNKVYSIIMLAIGMFEFQVDKLSKEFYADFCEYLDEAFINEIIKNKIPQLRPVPTEGSIAPDLPILPYDDLRKIIHNLSNTILVANCVCKQGHDLIGKPCKVTNKREICIVFGSAARNYHELGWGRKIDKEELKKILKDAEKDGLVVQPSNTKKNFCICLCCGDCCEVLTSAKKLDNPVQYFNSNYYAVVNADQCIGCRVCAKRCQMDAISYIDKKAVIDLSRCIGCGLCVPTCKPQAMSLKIKDKIIEPPDNDIKLYMSMLKKKIGNAGMIMMLTRRLFKKKI